MKRILIAIITLVILQSCNQNKKADIWMVGDSTMAAKSERRYPESGWGEGLKFFVNEHTTVHNHAASGRSTLSFINEGRWQVVLDSLKEGDFVIIQFGHNDEKPDSTLHTVAYGSFKDNLKKFVEESRLKGAHPIICSSIIRRHFDENNKLVDTHGDYISAAKESATETHTPYVDMEKLSKELVLEMGPDYSKAIYNFHGRKKDSTHPNYRGAKVFAYLFALEVNSQDLPLKQYLDINRPLLLW
jgi:lysophospholipase L1-like esterase